MRFWGGMTSKIEFLKNWPYGYEKYNMKSGQNDQYTTFPNIFSLISAESADLSHNQKNHIFEKNVFFGSKICSRRVKTGSIRKPR